MTSSSFLNPGDSKGSHEVPPPRRRWGTRVALPLSALLLFTLLLGGSIAQTLVPRTEVDVLPVVERPSSRPSTASAAATGSALIQAAGWIEPDPYPVAASALIAGTVEHVSVLEGDRVARGQVIARLVGDDARLALRRAEAELAAANAAWEEDIANEQAVASTTAVVRETSASLAVARAELAADMALARESERQLRRRTGLRDAGSDSEAEYDAAEADWMSRSAAVDAARARIDVLEARLDAARAQERAAQRTANTRTEERLRLELATVAAEEAALTVERLEVRAPVEGVVLRRLVEPGSRVMIDSDESSAAQVALIYDPARLQVRVDIPLADAAKVGVGSPAEVTVEVRADRLYRGVISRIASQADIQKNTLQVIVRLEEPAPELRPEMLARVRFFESAVERASPSTVNRFAVHVPARAVVQGRVVVAEDLDGDSGVARLRSIVVAQGSSGDWLEVESGLHPGDMVVVSDTSSLKDGDQLLIRRAGED